MLALILTTCPLPQAETSFASLKALPPPVIESLAPISDLDGPFNISDIGGPDGPPRRRFIEARGHGCELLVHYEQGGRGYGRPWAGFAFEEGRWIRRDRSLQPIAPGRP